MRSKKQSRVQQRTRKRKLEGKVRKGITLSTESKKMIQIEGFISCLEGLLSRYRLTLCKDFYKKYFLRKFRLIELSQMPKIFKLCLATCYSVAMQQENPPDFDQAFDLFPQGKMKRLIHKNVSKSFRAKAVFYWNLLQCKDLANTVSDEMVNLTYVKHASVLSSVGSSPANVLSLIRDYFREYCEVVKSKFTGVSQLPPKSAYLNTKKSEGGCLSYFKNRGLMTSHIFERRATVTGDWKIDPVVVHLTGKPGVGKSFLIEKLVNQISKKFGMNSDVYQRSIATDHWDGYRNNLITVIDDAFSSFDCSNDQKQILQVCSNVPLVLPMADLREKGKMFTSDFLFITSNNPEHCLKFVGTGINNPDAFFRRVYPAYEIVDYNRQSNIYRIHMKIVDPNSDNGLGIISKGVIELSMDDFIKRIVDGAMCTHRLRARHNDFVVPVVNNGPFCPNMGFKIPIKPPLTLPVVKAHAICEPLKVRIITKAEEECWVLKPVQKAMWEALKSFPCFKLTSGPEIPLDFIDTWDKKKDFLSGDYEAATDNLNRDIMELAVDELLKVLHHPFDDWIEYESKTHIVKYPKSANQPDIIQTRGQLMGSLLSFPILCVANAACIGIIKKQSLGKIEALINGDDIVFRESQRKIQAWKRLTKSIGLKPSVGKNYQSAKFFSINSQLLIVEKTDDGKSEKITHEATGCFGAISKVTNFISNIALALRIEPQNRANIINRARKVLKQTPQSIDVPIEFGGLGTMFHYPMNKFDVIRNNEIYFFKMLKRNCSILQETGDGEIICRIPQHLYMRYRTVLCAKSVKELPNLESEDLDQKIFDYRSFKKFQKWYKTVPYLRVRIANAHLPQEIPFMKIKTVCVIIDKDLKPFINNLHIHI